MGILIDTSVFVAADRGTIDLERIAQRHHGEPIAMSSITAAELFHGVHRQKGVKRARGEAFVERLVADIPVLPFDLAAARVHAALSAQLRAEGTPVGSHDLLIAATAILHDYQVATRDLRGLPRIKGLAVLQW